MHPYFTQQLAGERQHRLRQEAERARQARHAFAGVTTGVRPNVGSRLLVVLVAISTLVALVLVGAGPAFAMDDDPVPPLSPPSPTSSSTVPLVPRGTPARPVGNPVGEHSGGGLPVDPRDPEIPPVGPTAAEDQKAVDAQLLVSFTASPLSVAPGRSSRFDWSVTGPADVVLRLDGVALSSRSGLKFVHINDENERHVLTAHRGQASRELGAVIVGVNPCLGSTPPAQCDRDGVAAADYRRDKQRFVYDIADLEDPSPARPRRITLDACASEAGRHGRIERYRWTLRADDRPPLHFTSNTCARPVDVPEGVYGTTMTARAADGVELTTRLTVTVKDLFVVSIGDSMASGEGNPDMYGEYIKPPRHEAQWKHAPCHRSAFAGHAIAATELNADPHTGLTFLSLACTGAVIENLTTTPQGNQPPQLEALQQALCRWSCDRPIDVLIVTAGVNDLSFSTVVTECTYLHRGSRCDDILDVAESQVDQIDDRLDVLQGNIEHRGLNVAEVLVTEYPSNVVEGGCSIMTGRIGRLGDRLNAQLRSAVTANAADHWYYVGGVKAAFAGRSLCTGSPGMFGSLGRSLKIQGDPLGTAHPDKSGQRAIAKRILVTHRQVQRDDQQQPQQQQQQIAGFSAIAPALTADARLAVDPATIAAVATAAYSAYEKYVADQITLDEATGQILDAISSSRDEIIDHIDLLESAEGRACAEDAIINLADLEQLTSDNLQQFSRETTSCITLIDNQIPLLGAPGADRLGFALNIVGPVGLVARAKASLAISAVRSKLISANEYLIERFTPSCGTVRLRGDAQRAEGVEVQLRCRAYNGDVGMAVTHGSRSFTTTDYARARSWAARRTSRPIAMTALAALAEADVPLLRDHRPPTGRDLTAQQPT